MYNYFILSYFLKKSIPTYVPDCFSMQTQFIGKKDWRKAPPPPGIYFGALRGFLVSWLEDKVSQKCGALLHACN